MKNFIQSLKSSTTQRNILIAILILCIVYFKGCKHDTKIDTTKYEQNIAALTDSVRTYKAKNGDLVFEKNSLITSSKDLEKLNTGLANEVKYLKDHPVVVIKEVIKIMHDTIRVPIHLGGKGTWNADSTVFTQPFEWNHDTVFSIGNTRKIHGSFSCSADTCFHLAASPMTIDKDEFNLAIITGLTENKDKKLEIFVKSNYPNFSVSTIDGALIDPTESSVIKKFFPPKRWSVGPYLGYGVYFDPLSIKAGSGITIGVSVSYGLIQWK